MAAVSSEGSVSSEDSVSSEVPSPHEARFAALGCTRLSAAAGRSELSWTPTDFVSNSRGHVHGGLVGSIIDDCSAMAVHSTTAEPIATPTVSMHIDYVRPLLLGHTYRCRGSVVRVGGRLAVADTHIEDELGELCVRGTATFVILRGE